MTPPIPAGPHMSSQGELSTSPASLPGRSDAHSAAVSPPVECPVRTTVGCSLRRAATAASISSW
jgi:hypothetical protein